MSNDKAQDNTNANTESWVPLPPGADPALASRPQVDRPTGKLASLEVTPLIQGSGPEVRVGQKVTANYVGVSFRDGLEFDASWNRRTPFEFQIGIEPPSVIVGWDTGLRGQKVGSRLQVDIPSALAYGDNGRRPGDLRFIVDVLAAK